MNKDHMLYLYSREGQRELQEFLSQEAVLAFDFDGTLAPIVSQPEKAMVPARVTKLLKDLSRLQSVAVITGRSIADLKSRLKFKPQFIVGNHGLEGLAKYTPQSKSARQVTSAWVRQLQSAADFPLDISGVFLENKTFTLSLHYRRAKNKPLAKRRLKKAVDSLNPPPRVIPGKNLFNLVPPASPHKGNAIMEVLSQAAAQRALYIGDDDTDEDIFRMCDPNIFTIRVGFKRGSRACHFVKNLKEVERLLGLLAQWGNKQPAKFKSSSR